VDIYNRRVQKFTAAGRFLLMFGGGVNRTAARRHEHAATDRCPVRAGDVCGAGVEGPADGQLEFKVEGCFIAVGPGGVVWVGQRNRVRAYAPDGRYLRQIGLRPAPETKGNEAGGVSGLAISPAGDLYVIRHGIDGIQQYTPAGKLVRTFEQYGEPTYDEGPTPTLTVEPGGNLLVDVYAHETHRVDELSPEGRTIASFDRYPKAPPAIADEEDGLPGIAYDAKTKLLYLVNADINLTPRVARIRTLEPPRP
jgi:DNA-binding beta-propeller fold protein YncE